MKKAGFIVLLFLIVVKLAHAQFYNTGQDPAKVKWKQINTEHFQVIFQEDVHSQAQHIAKTLEFYYAKLSSSLHHQPKKISVIVHSQTITSNGYVAWAPKRVELYTTPSPTNYPDPWVEHLCIHELRHVVQVDKLNQGITKVLSIIFGQQATGLVAGQLPMWYYEGDAVGAETAFTDYGRGRIPGFHRCIKAHLLSKDKKYSFDKMLLGSYKDYVPNHYELGYQLTSYARKKYGSDIWSRIENHVAKNSYTLLPTSFAFYRGLKKNYGISQKDLFHLTMNYLDSTWRQDGLSEIEPKFFQEYPIEEYENYRNPIYIDNNYVIALKKGLSHIPQFVLIEENSEQIIFEPGYVITDDFSYANNLLVWAEYKPDIRWTNREFNSICLLNIKTKMMFTLIDKSRYFSPEISSDASKIVVVEVDPENTSRLVILDSFTGEVLQKIENQNSNFIARPKWSDDGESIYVIETTLSGKQVSKYTLNTDKWAVVFKSEKGDIQRIQPVDNRIYFHSTLNGTDNIYVYDQLSNEIYQISESRFGISDFSINANNKTLITNEYTSQGFRVATIPIEKAKWEKVSKNDYYSYQLAEVISNQEKEGFTDNTNVSSDYEVKPYRKVLNQFNFHSWIPFYYDYENATINSVLQNPGQITKDLYPGLMLLSQNKLSTTEAILSYAYKNNGHYISSSVVYKGQFPVFKISANYGDPQRIQKISEDIWLPETNKGYNYIASVYVPLNFTSGRFIRRIQPSISIEYSDDLKYNYVNDYYIRGTEYMQTGLSLYVYQIKAKRDIIPSNGMILNLSLFNTPFEDELFGYVFNIDGAFFIPGGVNKAFKVDLGYQYQNPNLYRFNSKFRFPRGIEAKSADKMFKTYTDYVFPIAYPDWNLGSAFYLKRIHGSLFLDYAYSTYRTVNVDRTTYIYPKSNSLSFGVELSMDYHLLRTIFPLNTGVRFGYAPSENKMVFDLIFGIDLFNF